METKTAVSALAALAQETRLEVFRLLVEAGSAGVPVGGIAERLQLAPATLSFHLKTLTQAGLILPRQQGRFIYYSADYARMNGLVEFLYANCCCGAETCAPAAACCAPDEVQPERKIA